MYSVYIMRGGNRGIVWETAAEGVSRAEAARIATGSAKPGTPILRTGPCRHTYIVTGRTR